MTQITASELLDALRASAKVEGRAGETRLDMIVRDAVYDDDVLQSVAEVLDELSEELHAADEWHALQLFVGQVRLTNRKLGERVISRIDGHDLAGEPALWAAHVATTLGATLKHATLQVLEAVIAFYPVQWFALMRQTQETKAIESSLLRLSRLPNLRPAQAVELVRGYKRWAVDNGVSWNVPLSKFLRDLPVTFDGQVSAKIARSLGPSFAIETSASVPTFAETPARLRGSLYDRSQISIAMEKVMSALDRSHCGALEAA